MSIVTITINNRQFQLSCEDGRENQLRELATEVNEKATTIKQANHSASSELVLLMTALSLQDQLKSSLAKLEEVSKKSDNNGNKTLEDEKFAETLSGIAKYLESLAQKIGK